MPCAPLLLAAAADTAASGSSPASFTSLLFVFLLATFIGLALSCPPRGTISNKASAAAPTRQPAMRPPRPGRQLRTSRNGPVGSRW